MEFTVFYNKKGEIIDFDITDYDTNEENEWYDNEISFEKFPPKYATLSDGRKKPIEGGRIPKLEYLKILEKVLKTFPCRIVFGKTLVDE